MAAPRVPPYLSPGQIGTAVGVSRDSAFTEVRNAGIAEKRGKRWRISATQLRERLPDFYTRVFEYFVLEGEDEPADPDRRG